MNGWKTVTALLLGLLIGGAQILGIEPTAVEDLPDWAGLILFAAAQAWAFYGRLRANGPAMPQITARRSR